MRINIIVFLALMFSTIAYADLVVLEDGDLSGVSGKGGVYLTGEFSINKDGGPLWESGTRPIFNSSGSQIGADSCDNGICGLRFAMKLNENSEGWYIIDDLSGGFSFEGLTLRTETLTSAFNYDNSFLVNGQSVPAEVQLPNGGAEVLKIGLPGTVSFKEFKFKYAVANNGEFGVPRENGTPFRQTDIFGVQIDGDLTLQGNLLLFPVD